VQAQIPLYKWLSAMAKVTVVKFKPQGSLGVRLVPLIGKDPVGVSFGPEKSRFMPCTWHESVLIPVVRAKPLARGICMVENS
jgi:hypothetical protein